MANKIETLIEMLAYRIETSQAEISSFIKKLQDDTDPLYAFEWSKETFQAAATIRVFSRVLTSLKKGVEVKRFYQQCLEEALRAAKYPKQTTSTPANFSYQCEGSAWAEVTELLKGALDA